MCEPNPTPLRAAREAGDGTRGNDRISSLLCRPAKIKLPDRTVKITHFLRQGQMIRTSQIRVILTSLRARQQQTAANMTAPPAICSGVIVSPMTRQAISAENGG